MNTHVPAHFIGQLAQAQQFANDLIQQQTMMQQLHRDIHDTRLLEQGEHSSHVSNRREELNSELVSVLELDVLEIANFHVLISDSGTYFAALIPIIYSVFTSRKQYFLFVFCPDS